MPLPETKTLSLDVTNETAAPTAMQKKFSRLAGLIEKQYKSLPNDSKAISFALRSIEGTAHRFGNNTPAFAIVLNNERAVTALSTLNQNTIIEAYLSGDIDIEGDIKRII
jgi:cyclopropane-fatty-acyl-phospholipid synthase